MEPMFRPRELTSLLQRAQRIETISKSWKGNLEGRSVPPSTTTVAPRRQHIQHMPYLVTATGMAN